MSDEGRQFNLDRWYPSKGPPSARHLNQVVDAVASMNRGTDNPVVTPFASYELDFPCAYLRARLLLTDSAKALSGLSTVDGATPADGDYIIRATGGTPGTDGLYRAAAGAWTLIARLNYSQTGNAPVYPHGSLISVWDGTSAPKQVQAGVTGAVTF